MHYNLAPIKDLLAARPIATKNAAMRKFALQLYQSGFQVGTETLMPNTYWTKLTRQQLGRYAEYYAKMEFASYGFDVYTSEVDDHGVDFVAKNKNDRYYEVQVKSTRPRTSYVFFKKDKAGGLSPNRLLCYVRFTNEDSDPLKVYIIPFEVWNEPKGMFVYHGNYKKPEYGMNCSEKNMGQLEPYRSEVKLPYLLEN